jgi:hypothetical protein
MGAQHAKGPNLDVNDDADATHHVMIMEERRACETALGTYVLDDNRLIGEQCIASLRLRSGHDHLPTHGIGWPSHPSAVPKGLTVRLELKDLTEFDIERLGNLSHRLVEQRIDVCGCQGALPQFSHHGLLSDPVA